jgi:AcrR family transcriptional regulator
MPRPARYTVDELLDSAAELLAAEGPSAVTMSAVARAVGAPSGSVYHRFATRAELCGELWVRTEERFQGGFTAALATSADPTDRCVAAALFTVRWCRANPIEAQVLLVGADALCRTEWSAPLAARRNRLRRTTRKVLNGLGADAERVNAAVVDVPYAIVRRHLVARQRIPESADEIVEDCARVLISTGERTVERRS